MENSKIDLKVIKQAAKNTFGNIDGVTGFGLGQDCLIIYIRNADVRNKLPERFHDVSVYTVVTGDISLKDS